MKAAGTVRQWDPARGFGFIRTDDSADVFFHVRDWRGGATPQVGTAVQFERIHVGGKGPRAMAVAPLGSAAVSPARTARPPGRGAPRAARVRGGDARRGEGLGLAWWFAFVVWIGVLAMCVARGRLPMWGLAVLAGVNVLTFVTYWMDKGAARGGAWRTPEKTLHVLSLVGGWPAARVAQKVLRHKSSKAEFLHGYVVTVVGHLGALAAWALGWVPLAMR